MKNNRGFKETSDNFNKTPTIPKDTSKRTIKLPTHLMHHSFGNRGK